MGLGVQVGGIVHNAYKIGYWGLQPIKSEKPTKPILGQMGLMGFFGYLEWVFSVPGNGFYGVFRFLPLGQMVFFGFFGYCL